MAEWFDSVVTIEDLLQRFEIERTRKAVRFSFYNSPQQVLAYAFTLAKLGKLDEAISEFSNYKWHSYIPEDLRVPIIELLKSVPCP